MPSTTALYTGLSGLATNSRRLDIIGNNIANVNTTAYKSNRISFASTFSRNFALGTAPGTFTGGTNPTQVGLGAMVAGTQRNFSNGAISATGVQTDMAIEGDGFFITSVAGERLYTRAGAFQRNQNNDLVTISGGKLMGYGVDEDFNVIDGQLVELNIPIGTMTLAQATRNAYFNGNLNASGTVATTGSVHESAAFFTDNGLTTLLADPNYDLTVPGNNLYIDDGTGNPQLAIEGGAGTIITVNNVEKGGTSMGTHTFAFSATPVSGATHHGTTLADYMDFLETAFGLDNSTVGGQTLGGAVSFSAGVISITGNEGTVQDLTLQTGDFVASNAGGGMAQPFQLTKTGSANGESVRTSMVVYDSLGTPVTVDLTFVLQSTTPGEGSVWQFVAESNDHAGPGRIVGMGSMQFDANGRFVSASNQSFAVARENGAEATLTVDMNFDDATNGLSALSDINSTVAAIAQDGSPLGVLASFAIGEDGAIAGLFSNGLTRTIGQLALAKFSNPQGLIDAGNNYFRLGPNSGEPLIGTPGDFGTGRVLGGALELSNVDLSQEFIDMILASTGYSAASRVITTTKELIDQLMVLGR